MALERLDGPAEAAAGSASTLQPSFAQNELLSLAGGSLWNVRNEAPEVRNFVVGERHDSVHAGYETFGDKRATHCMDEAPVPAIA